MLKQTREQSGMSQTDFAEKAGVKLRYLQELEQERRDINKVNLLTLLKICEALNCRLNNILTDRELIMLLEQEKERP